MLKSEKPNEQFIAAIRYGYQQCLVKQPDKPVLPSYIWDFIAMALMRNQFGGFEGCFAWRKNKAKNKNCIGDIMHAIGREYVSGLKLEESGPRRQVVVVRHTLADLEAALAQYDEAPLECDGLTRVIHTVLAELEQPHRIKGGRISHRTNGRSFEPHFWVELADSRPHLIDYRARMWLRDSEDVPHGIFDPKDYPLMCYEGEVIDWEVLSPELFAALTTPIPPQIREMLNRLNQR